MPTYYNGKEITSTSVMSGLSLVGRSSITIGGKVTTLSTPDPPFMLVYGDSGGISGYPDPGTACMFAGSGPPLKVFVKDNGGGNYSLFLNRSLTTPLSPGWWWSDDTTNIGGGFDPGGASFLVDPSGLVVMISRCGR